MNLVGILTLFKRAIKVRSAYSDEPEVKGRKKIIQLFTRRVLGILTAGVVTATLCAWDLGSYSARRSYELRDLSRAFAYRGSDRLPASQNIQVHELSLSSDPFVSRVFGPAWEQSSFDLTTGVYDFVTLTDVQGSSAIRVRYEGGFRGFLGTSQPWISDLALFMVFAVLTGAWELLGRTRARYLEQQSQAIRTLNSQSAQTLEEFTKLTAKFTEENERLKQINSKAQGVLEPISSAIGGVLTDAKSLLTVIAQSRQVLARVAPLWTQLYSQLTDPAQRDLAKSIHTELEIILTHQAKSLEVSGELTKHLRNSALGVEQARALKKSA